MQLMVKHEFFFFFQMSNFKSVIDFLTTYFGFSYSGGSIEHYLKCNVSKMLNIW